MAADPVTSKRVETLVIFDIEATGLPDSRRPPKITEFCMLAVGRNELMLSGGRPRIINKLQICVNPGKPIPPVVSQMTGLFNDHLESQKLFDAELIQLINGFLDRLPQPVCLLAHNGHGFDFPLLKAQILEANASLGDKILCCDSLIAFRDLGGEEPWKRHLPFLTTDTQREDCHKQDDSPPTFSEQSENNYSTSLQTSAYHTQPDLNASALNSSRFENDFQNGASFSNNTLQYVPLDLSASHINLNDLIRPNQDILIDENMNLSADVIPNQNIHLNNNNDQVVDLEEAMNSTPPENGLAVLENHDNNSQDMNWSPPRVRSPNEELRLDHPGEAVLNDRVHGRHGSPINDDDDMNSDPMNFKFSNESTPHKRPDIGLIAPRKIVPLKERIEPGRTRRQLNFDSAEPQVIAPCKLANGRKPVLELGKTKRRLDFEMNESHLQSKIGNSASCSSDRIEKGICDNEEPNSKRVCTQSELDTSQRGITPYNKPLQIDVCSLGDDDFLCAVEEVEGLQQPNVTDMSRACTAKKSDSETMLSLSQDNKSMSNEGHSVSHKDISVTHTDNTTDAQPVEQTGTPQNTHKTSQTRLSYSLVNLYRREFGKQPGASHTSEDDCLTLLEIIKKHSPEFIQWVDGHSVNFSQVIHMY